MTDPRTEAAANVLAEVTGEPRAGRFEYTMARAALAAADKAAPLHPIVADFINARTEYVDALKNTRGTDDQSDYFRWQGHAEARRQLAQSLGFTVPHAFGDKTGRGTE